ncbi:MAG TPA: hypothetical protein VMG10_03505 [Gemmataceae bacterium]|nr:hypothetical protein [Gemmataceae bacterium]
MRTCHFHSDRPGIGICMRCRVVICTACCTRVNGVNHCHACLKVLGGRREETRKGGRFGILLAGVLLGVGWLVLWGLCWAMSGKMAP